MITSLHRNNRNIIYLKNNKNFENKKKFFESFCKESKKIKRRKNDSDIFVISNFGK